MFVDKTAVFCGFSRGCVQILSTIVFFFLTYPPKKWQNLGKKGQSGQSYPQQKRRKIKGLRDFFVKIIEQFCKISAQLSTKVNFARWTTPIYPLLRWISGLFYIRYEFIIVCFDFNRQNALFLARVYDRAKKGDCG